MWFTRRLWPAGPLPSSHASGAAAIVTGTSPPVSLMTIVAGAALAWLAGRGMHRASSHRSPMPDRTTQVTHSIGEC